MIPILGVLVLNRPDLLERLIESIDYPVDKLAIVQNSSDAELTSSVDRICKNKHKYINSIYVERPFRNVGCAPGWNSIIKSFPESNFWLIANNDHVFMPGDLAKFHNLVTENMAFISAQTGSFSAFAVTAEVINIVGLFDENIWPIYCEDIDYMERLRRANIEFLSIDSEVGETRNGSWTIRSNDAYATANNFTQKSNSEYVSRKWGLKSEFKNPFNQELPVSWWTYNPMRRQEHSAHWANFESTAQRFTAAEIADTKSALANIIIDKQLVTDKNTIHSYIDHFYQSALEKYRDKPIQILEIGCDQGGSLALWAEYFTAAAVTGYDITYRGQLEQLPNIYKNISVKLQNAYDYAALANTPTCDIIIDDGPHTLESQLFFIKNYSLKLKPGGLLVIEDIENDQNLEMLKQHVPFHLKPYARVIDLRSIKNRYDDLMLVIELP